MSRRGRFRMNGNHRARAERQESAAARQREADGRSPLEQMSRLANRGAGGTKARPVCKEYIELMDRVAADPR